MAGKAPKVCKRCQRAPVEGRARICDACREVGEPVYKKGRQALTSPKARRQARAERKKLLEEVEAATGQPVEAKMSGTRIHTPEWLAQRREILAKARAKRQENLAAKRQAELETPVFVKKDDLPAPEAAPETMDVAAMKELAERELSRRKLLRFILRHYPSYKAGWFHIDLCERLEKFMRDIEDGLSPRLMLFVPPRHGKSMVVSQFAPAWMFGHHPEWEIIGSSYGAELSRDFSMKVQDLVKSAEYQQVFPRTQMKPGKEGIDAWRLTAGGAYYAVGVGGPLVGRGANVLIIDDPFKNREEADSALIRESIHKWYTAAAYTRLMPGAGILIIQQRWHFDDLSGRLLEEMKKAEKEFEDTGVWPEDADRWEIVQYPAIATEDEKYRRKGEALHPERYTVTALKKIKRTLGPRDWAALYQQTPVPDEGGYFGAECIKYYDHAPEPGSLAIYSACDLAISKKEHADFTVIITVGLDRNDDLWVLDMRRERMDSMQIIEQLFDVHRTWKPKLIGIEEGAIKTSIGPFLDKRIREERMYSLAVHDLKVKGRDKEARARPIQGRMKQGKVYIPRNAPYTVQLVEELMRFPNGTKDDCVDALAWVGQMLMEMNIQVQAPPRIPSWRDKLHKFTDTHMSSGNAAMAA